jgi:uracil-DNA glycosylase
VNRTTEQARFGRIFRKLHSGHDGCDHDEWLHEPCRVAGRIADRPIVWSRRNGPWRRVAVLWVGAAPGNAGGRGTGDLGAHGTRIPFGGDIAGANLEVMLGSVGLTRNDTFIVAALNELPASGGGEPSIREILAAAGGYPDSIALLRDTIIATGPSLIVALGNVAARVVASAWIETVPRRLTGPARLRNAGWSRGLAVPLRSIGPPADDLEADWRRAWGTDPDPVALWLTHPSAQNMSPHAGVDTVFHARMVGALDALRSTVRRHLGWTPPTERPGIPGTGIYALTDWTDRIRSRTAALDRLWREKRV